MAKRGAEEQLTKDGQNGNGYGARGDDETSTPVKATAAQLAGRKIRAAKGRRNLAGASSAPSTGGFSLAPSNGGFDVNPSFNFGAPNQSSGFAFGSQSAQPVSANSFPPTNGVSAMGNNPVQNVAFGGFGNGTSSFPTFGNSTNSLTFGGGSTSAVGGVSNAEASNTPTTSGMFGQAMSTSSGVDFSKPPDGTGAGPFSGLFGSSVTSSGAVAPSGSVFSAEASPNPFKPVVGGLFSVPAGNPFGQFKSGDTAVSGASNPFKSTFNLGGQKSLPTPSTSSFSFTPTTSSPPVSSNLFSTPSQNKPISFFGSPTTPSDQSVKQQVNFGLSATTPAPLSTNDAKSTANKTQSFTNSFQFGTQPQSQPAAPFVSPFSPVPKSTSQATESPKSPFNFTSSQTPSLNNSSRQDSSQSRSQSPVDDTTSRPSTDPTPIVDTSSQPFIKTTSQPLNRQVSQSPVSDTIAEPSTEVIPTVDTVDTSSQLFIETTSQPLSRDTSQSQSPVKSTDPSTETTSQASLIETLSPPKVAPLQSLTSQTSQQPAQTSSRVPVASPRAQPLKSAPQLISFDFLSKSTKSLPLQNSTAETPSAFKSSAPSSNVFAQSSLKPGTPLLRTSATIANPTKPANDRNTMSSPTSHTGRSYQEAVAWVMDTGSFEPMRPHLTPVMMASHKQEAKTFRANKWLSLTLQEAASKTYGEFRDFRAITAQYTFIMQLIDVEHEQELRELLARGLIKTQKPFSSHNTHNVPPSRNNAADGFGANKRKREADDSSAQVAEESEERAKKWKQTPQVKNSSSLPQLPGTEQPASGTAVNTASETSKKLGNLLQPSAKDS